MGLESRKNSIIQKQANWKIYNIQLFKKQNMKKKQGVERHVQWQN